MATATTPKTNATTPKTNATTPETDESRTEQRFEDVADRVRELNERIIVSGRRAGDAYLRTYERTLKSIADVQEEAGKASPFEWVTTMAKAQADFTRDIADAYAAAGRELVK